MVSDPHDGPTPAEWKVLRLVWERGECATRDVVAAAEGRHGWSASTVKTLLRRLVDKGHLEARRIGNSFLYTPTRSALSVLRRAADELLEHATGEAVAPLLAYMVRRSRLKPEELEQLRALLDEPHSSPRKRRGKRSR